MGNGEPDGPVDADVVARIAELRAEVDQLLAWVDVLIARREASLPPPPGRPSAA